MTFLVIGMIGLVLLVISLVAGDLFDGALDALAGDAFSSAVVGAFIAATGFGGAAALALGAPTLVATLVGVGAGAAFAWFAYWLTRLIKSGGSDDTPSTHDALGRDGRVISDIPTEGFGVVQILVGGHTLRLNARAEQPLKPGTQVYVTNVLSPTAVTVAPV